MTAVAILGYFNTLQLRAVKEIKSPGDIFSILFYIFLWDYILNIVLYPEMYCVFKLYYVTILCYQIFTSNKLVTSSFSCIENYISHALIYLRYILLF